MKTSVKVIIAIMAIMIVGLGVGLVMVMMQPKEVLPAKPDIETLEILLNDNALQDITAQGSDTKTYAINLNKFDKFSLKYVAKPLDLESYAIVVKSSSNAIEVNNANNLNASQSGVVDFLVKGLTEDGSAVTITFEAISNQQNSTNNIVAKVNVQITKPSTLQKVNNIRYNGSEIVWDAVTGNTESVPVASETIKYAVNLTYTIAGEEKKVSYTTKAGECKFSLAGVRSGFETGVVNAITVQALGNNINTADSAVSDEYKFYILSTPVYSFVNKSIKLTGVDPKANAIVLNKYVDGTLTRYQYNMINGEINLSLTSIQDADTEYSVDIIATVAKNSTQYNKDAYNTMVDNGVHYFDSVRADKTKVCYLQSVMTDVDNSRVGEYSIDGTITVNSYAPTRLSWTTATTDIAILDNVKYLVTINNGTSEYEYIVEGDYFDFTADVLRQIRISSSETDEYDVEVKPFYAMSDVDNGSVDNDAIDGMLVIDGDVASTSKVSLVDYYNISRTSLKLTTNGTVLKYELPTNASSDKLFDELMFVFVSSDGSKIIETRTQSGELDYSELLDEYGEYDLYILAKGVDGVVNPLIHHSEESVYKSIGAPTGVSLATNGDLTFEEVEYASGYDIKVEIGAETYSTHVNDNSEFNIIDFLETKVGYDNIASNETSELYKITISSVSSRDGWYGSESEVVTFGKLSSVPLIEGSTKYIDLVGNQIVWGKVNNANAYTLSIANGQDVVDVQISNKETFYNYKNTDFESALIDGDNEIMVIAKGVKKDNVVYLQSDVVSDTIEKLVAPSNISISNDILFFDASNNGKYIIEVTADAVVAETLVVENTTNSVNQYDLSTLTFDENKLYGIKVRRSLTGKFDSEYSSTMYVKIIPQRKMSVISYSSKEYIVWEGLADIEGVVYVSNADNTLTAQTVGEYVGVAIDSVSLNGSLGLISAGDYSFTLGLNATSTYVLTDNTSSNPAYVSSRVSRVNITRLHVPTITTSDYAIVVNAQSSKYSLSINEVGASDYIIDSEFVSTNSSYDTSTILTEAKDYMVKSYAIGNITSSADFSSAKTYQLTSAVAELEVTKLDVCPISLVEYEKKNVIMFANSQAEVDVEYQLYYRASIDATATKVNKSKYSITSYDTNSSVLVPKESLNGYYYIVQTTSENGYLSSFPSNTVQIIKENMSASQLRFTAEDELSWQDTSNISKKYYVNITGNSKTISYVVVRDNTTRTATIKLDASYSVTLSDTDQYGIRYENDQYTINIAYLKAQGLIETNIDYVVTITTIGTIDSTGSVAVAYNDANSGLSTSFKYHGAYTQSIVADDKLTIPISSIPSGYTTIILEIEGEEKETYIISTTQTTGNITSDKGNTLKLTRGANSAIVLDFDSYDAGEYSLTLRANKADRLGVVTEISGKYTIEKINTFDHSTTVEKLAVHKGKLYITSADSDRQYKFYNATTNELIGTYSSSSGEIAIDYSNWEFNANTFDIQFYIVVSESGKLISDISTTYSVSKLLSSTINMALTYENVYDFASYVITWSASNLDGTVDKANAYVIKIVSGSNTVETLTINANESVTEATYTVVYNNGHYTLTIADSAYPTIDKTKTTTFSLIEVVGDNDTSTTVTSSDKFSLSNNSVSTKQVQYLNTNIEIKSSGKNLIIGRYNIDCTAQLNIYSSTDVLVYSKTLNVDEVRSGITIDLSKIDQIIAGTYVVRLRYIGNNMNLVTSEEIVKSDVVKSTNPVIQILDGKVYITNAVAGAKYDCKLIVDGEVIDTATINCSKEDGKQIIDTLNIPEGDSKIQVTVTNSNEITSNVVELDVYKLRHITNLTKSFVSQGSTTIVTNLQLNFTANNMHEGVDRVEAYRLIFTSKTNSEKYVIDKSVSDVTAEEYSDGVYTFTITNLSDIINTLGTEFTVAIVLVGNNSNIENLSVVSGENIVDVIKVTTPTSEAINITDDGIMEVSGYTYPTASPSYTIDKVTIRFVSGVDTYTYTNEDFDQYTSTKKLEIDFTITQVYHATGWTLLPSGQYNVFVSYDSISTDVIAGDELQFVNITKTEAPTSVNVDSYSLSWDSSFDNTRQYYNYMITKPGQVASATTNNYTYNTINHSDNSNYPSGTYSIRIQKVTKGELKSAYSNDLTYTKLSPIELDAEVVRSQDDYSINVSFAIPDSNYSNGDQAFSYRMTIGNRTYIINTEDFALLDEITVRDVTSDPLSEIAVSYDSHNHIYTVKIDITAYPLFEPSSTDYVIAENNAGRVVISGVGDTVDTIVIRVDQIVGKNANKVLAINLSDIPNTSAVIKQLQTSTTTMNITDGVLNVEGYSDVDATLKQICFYKQLSSNVYDIDNPYIWNLDDNTTNINLNEILDSGYYLVALQYIGDPSSNIIDSSIQYKNGDVIRINRVSATPNIYIEDGVLKWTSVAEDNEDVKYELYLTMPSGEKVVQELTNTLYYNTASYSAQIGTYQLYIRAVANNSIRSQSSAVFTAHKLVNPSVELVREDNVLKLRWQHVDNATKYTVYDYYVNNIKTVATDIAIVEGLTTYEWVVNTDVSYGEHKYYVVAHGTGSTIDSNGDYDLEGYLTSYNYHTNTNASHIISSTAITNTTTNIWISEGIVNWETVANVDYYNVSIEALLDSGETVTYKTSVRDNKIDTSSISYLGINTAKKLSVAIENICVSNNYFVVSQSATSPRPLTNIIVFNAQQDKIYKNISVNSGMIMYSITKSEIETLSALINTYKTTATPSVDLKISEIFLKTSSPILTSYISPVITINSVEYILGTDIEDYAILLYNGNAIVSQTVYSEISKINPLNNNIDKLEIYIPLPSNLPFGEYNITFRALGNTTTTINEVAYANSINSAVLEGYKLNSPSNIFVETDNSYEMRNGVLKFTPTPTIDSNNSVYIGSYMIQFVASNDNTDVQQVVVNVTNNKQMLYSNNYAGYIDIDNRIVEIDIYNLFVISNTELNETLYKDFRQLKVDVDYHIRIKALGGLVVDGSAIPTSDHYTNYFDSNYSHLKKTFKVLSAPEVYIYNEAINWEINNDVSSYTIYFYDYNDGITGDLVYSEELTEIYGMSSVYSYTNIRNNSNLPAGIYNIKVIANGNGDEKLTSRLSDCKDFVAEKLSSVEVSVVDGLYTWKNSLYNISKTVNVEFFSEPRVYMYYIVDIYMNGEFQERQTIISDANETTTTYELPEKYPSAIDGVEVRYSINVYTNTNFSYNNCLLSSDDCVGFDPSVGRIRSEKIDTTFTITKDGGISWVLDSADINDYIVFLYNRTGGGEFVSGKISEKQFNIYNLRDEFGNLFDAESGDYIIKFKSIDKTLYSDSYIALSNQKDGKLRSVFTDQFIITLVSTPNFKITEGDIDWDTTTSTLGQEKAKARIIISGDFLINGSQVDHTLWLEFPNNICSFNIEDKLIVRESKSSTIVDHYLYEYGVTVSSPIILQFIEGENYDISIRFIGVEETVVEFNRDNGYIISSLAYSRKIHLLTNPRAPINPKLLEGSAVAKEINIYNNIPFDSNYKNFIFWEHTMQGGNAIENYDVEIYVRDKNSATLWCRLDYEFKLRNIISNPSVILRDVAYSEENDVTDLNYLKVVDGVGVYLTLDKVLKDIYAMGYDFSKFDICVYVEAVGSTVTHNVNNINQYYHVTNHYALEDKLAISDSNDYVLTVTLPAVPQDLDYNNLGEITWQSSDNSGIYHELVVAYLQNSNTVEDVNYDNISRLYLSINSDRTVIELVDENGEDVELSGMMSALNITEEQFNIMFSNGQTYHIDTITIPRGVSSYKLRYVTSSIKAITIRAISVLIDQDNVEEFVDEFISNPVTIIRCKNLSDMTFSAVFDGGDGSENNPFLVSDILQIVHYMEEFCYYELTSSNTSISGANSYIFMEGKKTFNGILDGKGAVLTISYNMTKLSGFDTETRFASLFYEIGKNAMIMNIDIVAQAKNGNGQDAIVDIGNQSPGGSLYVAPLAYINNGTIANVDVSGKLHATSGTTNASHEICVAGLTIYNYGKIAYCDVSLDMSTNSTVSEEFVAGLTKVNGDRSKVDSTAIITMSSFSGNMVSNNIGGLVYEMFSGKIEYSKNTGSITYHNNKTTSSNAQHFIGGLVGYLYNVTNDNEVNTINITNSFVELEMLNINIVNNYYVRFGGLVAKGDISKKNGQNVVKIATCYSDVNANTYEAKATIAEYISSFGAISSTYDIDMTFEHVYYNTNDSKCNKAFGATANPTGITAYTGEGNYNGYNPSLYYSEDETNLTSGQLYYVDGYTYNNESGLLIKNQ